MIVAAVLTVGALAAWQFVLHYQPVRGSGSYSLGPALLAGDPSDWDFQADPRVTRREDESGDVDYVTTIRDFRAGERVGFLISVSNDGRLPVRVLGVDYQLGDITGEPEMYLASTPIDQLRTFPGPMHAVSEFTISPGDDVILGVVIPMNDCGQVSSSEASYLVPALPLRTRTLSVHHVVTLPAPGLRLQYACS